MGGPKSKTRSHEHELNIEASPETVWKTITSAEELVNWFPLQAEAKLGTGGHLTYRWGPDLAGTCRIETWDPPRHLRTSWMEATLPEGSSKSEKRQLAVDWFIEGKGGRTVLRLVHSGFGYDARWDEEFEGTRRGWNYELGSLKHYLERHTGKKRRVFWIRRPVKLSAAQVWERFTGPNGIIREGKLDSLGAGDRYRITMATGDEVKGVVRINTPPQEFAGTTENFNDGLMRFGFENCGKGPEAHIMMSTWGVPAAETNALEKRWREVLQKTFA